MTATSHALVGASLAAVLPNPAIGIGAAFVSHFILDAIPHWDFGSEWKRGKLKLFVGAVGDVILSVALVWGIFGKIVPAPYLWTAVFASQAADWIAAFYWFGFTNWAPIAYLDNFQRKIQGKLKLPWGLLFQGALVGIVVLVAVLGRPAQEALAFFLAP